MSEVTKPIMLDETGKRIAAACEAMADAMGAEKQGTIYGMYIDGSEADPYEKVTYLRDAVGMVPAFMDFSNNAFNYGSWENAFFMPRPCMLKYDGTVDYYLDPDDYSKKADGTASDIADTSYGGNAMMEWGRNGKKIWLKVAPSGDGKSANVYIADYKVDEGFHDYSFRNSKGFSAEHFYTPIYNGSVISSKMRSLSGQQVSSNLQASDEITAAKENNTGADELWNIECLADRILINFLLVLIGKSTNTQAIFGQGASSGGTEAIDDTFRTGVHNAKGLFYGTDNGAVASNDFANAVKVFGMENYFGFQWRRTNGYILADGVQKVKLTYGTEDGSQATGYNTDGTNYIPLGITPEGTNGGYIKDMIFTEQGMFGKNMSGQSDKYFCDGQWFNNYGALFARFGGGSTEGALVGAFSVGLNSAASSARWYGGAALSCKPLE